MEAKEVFDGVFMVGRKLATRNLTSGTKVYGEELVRIGGSEYRLWNPYRSKLAAAILLGMRGMRIGRGSKVLYLGAATGTTSSHVSDIVGKGGLVYCIEISERSMRELVGVCESRENMLPMLKDARDTDSYAKEVGVCDVLYQDIAARDQADILQPQQHPAEEQGHGVRRNKVAEHRRDRGPGEGIRGIPRKGLGNIRSP